MLLPMHTRSLSAGENSGLVPSGTERSLPDLDRLERVCCCHGTTSGYAACNEGAGHRVSRLCLQMFWLQAVVLPSRCRHDAASDAEKFVLRRRRKVCEGPQPKA